MNRILATCGLIAMVGLGGCEKTPPDTHDADVKAIRANEAQWNKDWEAKDLDKLVAHYADDAVLMAPANPAANGKDAIRAMLKPMMADPAVSLTFQASKVDVAKSGDLGYTQGFYTMVMTNPVTKKPMNDKGSYVTVYKKQPDGAWKAEADIASSEVQPEAPTAPLKQAHPKAKAARVHKRRR